MSWRGRLALAVGATHALALPHRATLRAQFATLAFLHSPSSRYQRPSPRSPVRKETGNCNHSCHCHFLFIVSDVYDENRLFYNQ